MDKNKDNSTPGFLSDRQRQEHFMGVAGINPGTWKWTSIVKIYKGAEILLYHYNSKGLLTFDTVITCTDFTVSEQGVRVTFMDRKDFQLTTVGDVPNKIAGLDILTSVPIRCMVERTVKVTGSGRRILGMTAAIVFHSRSNPRFRFVDHVYAVPLTKAKKFFRSEEYSAAERKASIM